MRVDIKQMEDWRDRLNVLQVAHFTCSAKAKLRDNFWGFLSIALSGLVASSLFVMLEAGISIYLQVTAGVLSAFSAGSAGYHKFAGFAELSHSHGIAGGGYSNLKREIESKLVYPDKITPEDPDYILKQWAEVDKIAPTIPAKVWDKTRKEVRKKQ